MKRRSVTPQFDPTSTSRGRRFERWFLFNRTFNQILSEIGKIALTCLVWPRFVAPFRWELTRRSLPLGNVGAGLVGYKILQLTDLHLGRTRPDYLERVFRKCLAEKPDLVVITGDLIDYDPKSLPILERLLKPLVAAGAPDGVAAIFGNHDYHENSWRHVGKRSAHRTVHRRLVKVVERAGVRLLRDEQLRVRRAGDALVIVGMDEMWTELADPAKAFAGLSGKDAVICLQHNPDGIEFLKEWPWGYMMCGHTHGGQADFPVVGPLFLPMKHTEYVAGEFLFPALPGQGMQERRMFVSRGLGYSYPIRMRCAPEATLFTVTR